MADVVRALEHVHGHLGWLATASLLHPAILLRRPRRAHLAVLGSTALVTLAGGIGASLYGPYRDRVKQGLFVASRSAGLLFERKEHLAFGALAFAWAGLAAYAAGWRADGELRRQLLRLALTAYVAAAVLSAATAALGTLVATARSL